MKEIFDHYIETSFGELKQAEFKFDQFNFNYKQYFIVNKNNRVLDIGIGRGEMLTCMKNWDYVNYLGLDISPSTVSFCKSIGLNCELTDDTIKWLDENKNEFSIITLLDVLEHFKKNQIVTVLKSIHSALNADGFVIIQVPNLQAPDGQLHRYNDITHEIGFVEHSLTQVLRASGFDILEFKGFEGFCQPGFKISIIKLLRTLYWIYCRFTRKISDNLNPQILNPVMFVVAKKNNL